MTVLRTGLVEDAVHPGMWRIRHPDGTLSDMVNITRARDALANVRRGPARDSFPVSLRRPSSSLKPERVAGVPPDSLVAPTASPAAAESNTGFDRVAYQREYMRKRRAAKKAEDREASKHRCSAAPRARAGGVAA
jgi:hypothetical protein